MQRRGQWRDGAGVPSQFPAAPVIVANGAHEWREVIEAPAVD